MSNHLTLATHLLEIASPGIRLDSLSPSDVIEEALQVGIFAAQEWNELISQPITRNDGKRIIWNGLEIGITHEVGDQRFVGSSQMRASYGRIHRSWGQAEDGKSIDCYIAPDFNPSADTNPIYRVIQRDPMTGMVDERKYFFGYSTPESVRRTHIYHAGVERFGSIEQVQPGELDVYRKDANYHADSCGCEACEIKAKKRKRRKRQPTTTAVIPVSEEGERSDADDQPNPDEDDELSPFVNKAQRQVKKAVDTWTNALGDWMRSYESLEQVRDALESNPVAAYDLMNGDAFADVLANSMIVADLAGRSQILDEINRMDSLSDVLVRQDSPDASKLTKLPFEKAITYFRKKVIIPADDYKAMQEGYHDWAFSISGISRADILEDAKWLIQRAMEDGTSYEDFTRQWARLIGRKSGWNPGGKRLYTIFDTNIRSANGTGRGQQMLNPEVAKRRPLIIWKWRDSTNPRLNHQALHNKAIPSNHPFWQKARFPAGFGCLTGDSLVETPSGLKRIDKLNVGDRVIGGSGYINTISAVHTIPFKGQLVRTVSKDRHGTFFSVITTPNHRFLSCNGWIEASMLKIGDEIIKSGSPSIPESILQDISIGEINHKDSSVYKNGMPSPLTSGGSSPYTLNPDIEFRQVNVNPVTLPKMLNVVVVDEGQSTRFQIPYNDAFYNGRLCISIRVNGRIFSIPSNLTFESLFPDFGFQKGTTGLELFSNTMHHGASLLGSPQSGMPTLSRIPVSDFFQNLAGNISSFGIPFPLSDNRITPSSGQVVEVQKLHNRSIVDSPQFAQLPDNLLLFDVSKRQGILNGQSFNLLDFIDDSLLNSTLMFDIGFNNGNMEILKEPGNSCAGSAPPASYSPDRELLVDMQIDQGFSDRNSFEFFNSLDSLVRWSRLHHAFTSVVDVCVLECPNSINVFDLSVYPDQSYVTPIGVTHNCRCAGFTVTEEYCRRNGIEILNNPPDPETIAEEGFRYPLAGLDEQQRQEQMAEMMKRVDPKIRDRIQEEQQE